MDNLELERKIMSKDYLFESELVEIFKEQHKYKHSLIVELAEQNPYLYKQCTGIDLSNSRYTGDVMKLRRGFYKG